MKTFQEWLETEVFDHDIDPMDLSEDEYDMWYEEYTKEEQK